jgi:hypothetical protein
VRWRRKPEVVYELDATGRKRTWSVPGLGRFFAYETPDRLCLVSLDHIDALVAAAGGTEVQP